MGCDIHAYLEVEIGDVWHYFGQAELHRNYNLFARMADVRSGDGCVEPIDGPRGLPDDISAMTRIIAERWDGDGHSHSWLDLDEIKELKKFCDENGFRPWVPYGVRDKDAVNMHIPFLNIWLFGNYIDTFDPKDEDENRGPHPVQDVRLVFFFDN